MSFRSLRSTAPAFIVLSALLSILLNTGALAQWSTPVRISEPGGIDHPQILAQGDTLHVVYDYGYQGIGTGIGYLRSTNAGLSWGAQLELSDTANGNPNETPRIMAFGTQLMVVWRADIYRAFYRFNIGYSISQDDGGTWSEPAYIFGRNWDLIGKISATNLDSLITVVFNADMNPELTYFTIRSTDFGASWSDTLRLFVVDGSSVPDQAAGNGITHFAWGGRFIFGDPYEVYYIRSTDAGLTWSQNVPLSQVDGHSSQRPALAVNEIGNPAVSWRDHKYSPYFLTDDIFARWSYDRGENWLAENQVTHNHLAMLSDISWVRDTIRVAWEDWRFQNLTIYYASADDSNGVWSPEEGLEDGPDESERPALAASNGKVYVVWYDEMADGGLYFTRNPAEPDAVNEEGIPDKFEGLQAHPNPFNSNVSISYSHQKEKGGKLEIYDIEGRKVRAYNLTGKEGKIEWDATDASGKTVSSGIYFARAEASQNQQTIKLTYLK